MDIINTIKHEKLGIINCIADEDGYPLAWIKNKEVNLFSNKLKNIVIKFNFYCFNKVFKYEESDRYTAQKLNENISKLYKDFLNSREEIEKEFYRCYKEEIKPNLDEVSREEIIINSKDMYKFVEIKEVRIYSDGFAVIIKTPWYDEELGVEKKIEKNGESWMDVSFESSIEPVEMNYND
ncbi:hypothetical protein [Clostridium gasigenes]|uniref:hypothetical protein n=1 Tax=Clostridium gasigenes TaxID=94869 RepID=UPI001C0AA1D0|nr:hypothetical protein [Clostridium gasigenes]MBU3107985.1 hypothetical protein [Clostridium gasigenes]